MEKLISMTEFVLSYKYTSETPVYNQQSDKLRAIERYANFLNKPLELGYFIPCDLGGNPLEEPKHYYDFIGVEDGRELTLTGLLCKQYLKAKERILFKGFEFKTAEFCDELMFEIYNDKTDTCIIYDCEDKNFQDHEELFFEKIESLCYHDLELTQTALKQIGYERT